MAGARRASSAEARWEPLASVMTVLAPSGRVQFTTIEPDISAVWG